MPFGRIFAGLVFGWWALLFVAPRPSMFPPAFRWSEICAAVLLGGLAVGLFGRRGWPRWLGILVGAGMFAQRAMFLPLRAAASDLFLLIGLAIAVVLLAIPATGARRRDAETPETPEAAGFPVGGGDRVVADARFDTAERPAGDPHPPAPPQAPPAAVATRSGWLAWVTGIAMIATLGTGVYTWATAPRVSVVGSAAVEWQDFGGGLALAATEGKPMMVDFFAEWCGPCKTMDEVTFRHPGVVERLHELAIPVRIDVEDTEDVGGYVGEELAEEYDVFSYPTLMLIDADGKIVARRSSAMSPSEFLGWLERMVALHALGDGGEDPDDPTLMM